MAATIRYWREPKVAAMAVLWLALELLSLGGATLSHGGFQFPGYLLPFHWLQGSPVLSQALPDRLSILADGAAGAVLAFSLDLARRAAPASPAWRRAIPAVVAAAAVLPLVPLPYPAAPVAATPAGWQAAFARLRLAPGARVIAVPVALQRDTEVMRWEADTGDPATMIGGYFIAPDKSGQQEIYSPGPATTAAQYLDDLWKGPPPSDPLSPGLIRADIAYWRPAAVVAVTSPGSRLARYLAGLFGPPAFALGGVLAWRPPGG